MQINERKAYTFKIYVTQKPSLGNKNPKKQKNLNAFILDWTKRGDCRKVTEIYEETKNIKIILIRTLSAEFSQF